MNENAANRLKSYFEDILRDRTRLVRILLILLILFLALIMRIHESNKSDITVTGSNDGADAGTICVDIGGGVVSPGVYNVSPDTRLYEVIEMAGGLLSNADTDMINRAEFVEDGEKIVIPLRPLQEQAGDTDLLSSEVRTSAGADAAEDVADVSASSSSTVTSSGAETGLININYATKEELMTLPGIGEAKAEKIIEYRTGCRFKKKEDIKSVKGIGDSIYDKIKDSITV